MTTSFRDERTYDASAEALYRLWTDPGFQEERSRHLGTREVRCRRDGDVVVLEEARDTGFDTPPFESRLSTTWDPRTRRGRWELEQTGGPGRARAEGTVAIVEEGPDRARMILEGRLTIDVRWVGPMVERLAVAGIRKEKAKEARFVARALRERAAQS